MVRILVVDDEMEIAKALRRLLRRTYTVEIAGSGEEALDRLEDFRPNVVISDLRMPGMSGTTLLETVRSRFPKTVCVLISGLFGRCGDTTSRYVRLDKPWDDEKLTEMIARLVAASQADTDAGE